MLICRRKQLVVLFATLFILLAQFAVLAHATDHPFHQEDEQCISFQSTGLDKHLFSAALFAAVNTVFISDIKTVFIEAVPSSSHSFYSSRAPPATTI